jgi:hypothetical protein
VAIIAIGSGIASLSGLGWSYVNYWGGLVFGPALILIGLLLLYAVFFRWDRMQGDSSP